MEGAEVSRTRYVVFIKCQCFSPEWLKDTRIFPLWRTCDHQSWHCSFVCVSDEEIKKEALPWEQWKNRGDWVVIGGYVTPLLPWHAFTFSHWNILKFQVSYGYIYISDSLIIEMDIITVCLVNVVSKQKTRFLFFIWKQNVRMHSRLVLNSWSRK